MGLTILHLEIPRSVRQTSSFHLFRMKGKQNGKDSGDFVMVTNNTKSKLRKDKPMPIWVPMNNMSTTLNALHRCVTPCLEGK
jgi:hypothetical protein